MSRSGIVRFFWGDDYHSFKLGIAQLEELQEKTDRGPMELHDLIAQKRWRIGWLTETHRIGLMGGGMKPEAAFKLVQRYAGEPPFAHLSITALVILESCLIGARDGEKPGKSKAVKAAASFQTESFPSPPSTDQLQQ